MHSLIVAVKEFILERPGYLKKGPYAIVDGFYKKTGITVLPEDAKMALNAAKTEVNQIAAQQPIEALPKEKKAISLEEFLDTLPQVDTPSTIEEILIPKKAWQTPSGEMRYSYVVDNKQRDEAAFEKIRKELAEYVLENQKAKQNRPVILNKPEIGSATAVISDIHIGALIGKLVKIGGHYSIKTAQEYLTLIADEINALMASKVNVVILGDIIESFTGLNHPSVWHELDKDAHGSDIVITAFEMLRNFLYEIDGLANVVIVSGNHDRSGLKQEDDPKGNIAHLLYYFLNREFDQVEFMFDPMLQSFTDGGITYICTHGHQKLVKKHPAQIVLNYGVQGNFNLMLSGHLHNRSKGEFTYDKDLIPVDSIKFRHLIAPSLFTGNFYSEAMGFTTAPGFLLISEKYGQPVVRDIPLPLIFKK